MPTEPAITFVHPQADAWRDWAEQPVPPDPDEASERFRTGRDHTITHYFLRLKRRGHSVSLAARFTPGAICVAHCDDLDVRRLPINSFVVAIQNDRFAPSLCELRVVPNELQARSWRDFHLPYYTQCGLIPRDPARGTRVQRVAFFGIAKNLASEYQSHAFLGELARRGVEFDMRERDWHDFSNVDVILAVRTDYSAAFLKHKLALKLFNAWTAGVPALLGPEPAYQAQRRSDLDYIEVFTPEEALAAIDRLQGERVLFGAMVRNGLDRADALRHDRVTDAWEAFLYGPCVAVFDKWRREGLLQRGPLRTGRYLWRALRQHMDRRRWWNENWWRNPAPQA